MCVAKFNGCLGLDRRALPKVVDVVILKKSIKILILQCTFTILSSRYQTMKSALVIGASRGIGRQIAVALSNKGYKVGVAAKSVESTEHLPGSIYTVSKEIEELGGTALPIKCNVRNEEDINTAVETCIDKFGGLDYAIYNAGAVIWAKVQETPVRRFNMLNEVNLRGSYCMIQSVLPHFLKEKKGKILLVSPPIYSR